MISLERIRLADGEPIALMHNFLPAALVHLSIEMLEEHGLYELLRASGIRMGSATQRMCAKNASAAEARTLDENRGAALLTMERIAYDDTGRPVEFGQHLYRASRYAFTTSWPRGNRPPARSPVRAVAPATAADRPWPPRRPGAPAGSAPARTTSATGTSHHASLAGAGTSGSVSMCTRTGPGSCLAWASAARSSATVCARCTAHAEALRVGGQVDRQHAAVQPAAGRRRGSGTACRTAARPTVSDSAPMEAKPWFCTSTTMILMPSCTAVTSSCGHHQVGAVADHDEHLAVRVRPASRPGRPAIS